jgi:hypothetical protein
MQGFNLSLLGLVFIRQKPGLSSEDKNRIIPASMARVCKAFMGCLMAK